MSRPAGGACYDRAPVVEGLGGDDLMPVPPCETSPRASDLRETIAGFLHAVRNPLAVIRSSAQVGQRLATDPATVASYLASIVVQADRIEQALQGLQRLARMEPAPATAVVVAEAAAQAVERVRERAAARGTSVEVGGGPEAAVQVNLDQLLTAVDELLDNAVRLAPPGSVVSLSWTADEPGRAHLHCDDRGPGVAADQLASIRRPFFSTDRTRLGLGLALVERVCHLSGGSLACSNRPGGGCRFTLELPAAAGAR